MAFCESLPQHGAYGHGCWCRASPGPTPARWHWTRCLRECPLSCHMQGAAGVSCINIQEEFGGTSWTHSLQGPLLAAASFPHKSLLSTRHLPLLVPDDALLWQPAGQATWGAPHREAPASAVHLLTKHLCRTVYFQGHTELNHQGRKWYLLENEILGGVLTGQDVIFHPISNTDLGAANEGADDMSGTKATPVASILQQCYPLGKNVHDLKNGTKGIEILDF